MYEVNASESRKQFNTTITIPELTEGEIKSEYNYDGPHGYGYRPAPVFMGGNPDTCIMIGCELEVDKPQGSVNRNELSDYLHSKYSDRIYCKTDGSLDRGVEIVSHPATLAYHMRKFGWADILHACDVAKFSSHDTDTCGLHFHVGRAALGNTEDARDLCTAKILILMEKFYNTEIYKISRRRHMGEMERWAGKNYTDIKPEDKRPVVLHKYKEHADNCDRYHALNLTNNNTIEFRFFKGTLNPVSFAAGFQFVDSIVRYCKTHTLQEVVACKFGDIVDMCKYPELRAYCERRNVNMDATGTL